jgi:hypothetical protein
MAEKQSTNEKKAVSLAFDIFAEINYRYECRKGKSPIQKVELENMIVGAFPGHAAKKEKGNEVDYA